MTEDQWTSVTSLRHSSSRRGKFRNYSNNNNINNNNNSNSNNKRENYIEIKKRQQNTNNYGLYQTAYGFPFCYDMANSFSNSSIDSTSDISSGGGSSPNITEIILPPTSELAPYHIELFLVCPFSSCQIEDEFKVKITDSTYLIEHLKEQHLIHFVNLHHVYLNIEKYLQFWAKQFAQEEDIIKQLDTENDGDHVIHVIDPKKLPLDKDIREKLQREKLNEVLQIQANERSNDSKLQKKCLFCNNICENRQILFRHMFDEHNFNIGLPDNLVNISEFLQILEDKLNSLQCLYCEKTFTTPATLRKHMRKKKHFKISVRNRIYDKFYVINYLEPGKNWETFENERYESDEDHNNRDDSWDDWNEEELLPTLCLFCENISPSTKEVENHMKNTHGFDILTIKRSMGLDFYQTIILINYIRYKTSNITCMACNIKFDNLQELNEHMNKENCFVKVPSLDDSIWSDPKYLLPTQVGDPLLGGFEDGKISSEDDEEEDDLHFPNNTVIIPEKTSEELEEEIKQMLILNPDEFIKNNNFNSNNFKDRKKK